MGFGIKSIVKEARSPERAVRQVPTNANDITGNTRRLIGHRPANINSTTDSLRAAWKTRGASVISGYEEGSKSAHDKAVAEKKAKQAAAAAEQQRMAQEAAAAKKAAFDARMNRERSVNNAYVDSLSAMRTQATPMGVQGARYGDINRRMANGAPMMNQGMIVRSMMNPNLGGARFVRSRQDVPNGVFSGPGIPRNPSPMAPMAGTRPTVGMQPASTGPTTTMTYPVRGRPIAR